MDAIGENVSDREYNYYDNQLIASDSFVLY